MDVGIGLPSTVPGVEGGQLTEWSRRAEEAGFSSLGAIDRIVYPNYEPLIALAAAGAVTGRIRLMSTIAIVPYRANAARLAKQAATIHRLSGGRFVFGAAVGAREDDYAASGVSIHERGRRMDEMLADIERYWRGDEVGPKTDPPPPFMVGGSADAAFRRTARDGAGWIMGGGTPEMLADGRERAIAAFAEAGREGQPRIAALAYYGLGVPSTHPATMAGDAVSEGCHRRRRGRGTRGARGAQPLRALAHPPRHRPQPHRAPRRGREGPRPRAARGERPGGRRPRPEGGRRVARGRPDRDRRGGSGARGG